MLLLSDNRVWRANLSPVQQSAFEAATALGLNYHGPSVFRLYMDPSFSDADAERIGAVPFNPGILRESRSSHMLVATTGLSLMDIFHKHSALLDHPSNHPWYKDEEFANEPLAPGWHLLRIGALPGSLGKSRAEQLRLLPKNETIPSAAVVTYAFLLRFLASRDFTGQGLCLRTSGTDSEGRGLQVALLHGYSGSPGSIHVYSDDGYATAYIGLATEVRQV